MIRQFLERPTFGGDDTSPEDRVAAIAAQSAIGEARDKNEHAIEWLAVGTSVIGAVTITWRGLTTQDRSFVINLVIALAVGSYYATSLWRANSGSTRVKRWGRVTLEVMSATAVTLVNVHHSPELGLTSAAHYTYFLVIAVASLRLDPWVSLYAAALAILSHLGIYTYVWLDPDLATSAVHPASVTFRTAVMGMSGVVGYLLAHTLREKTMKVATETLARERVRSAFGSYVDERVVSRILSGTLSTGPERRTITVLFLDIRSFTAFAESRDAVEVFQSLHEALDVFSAEIQRQGGIVNKFLGDGLLALFGAPEPQADHARRAVRAALNIAAEARRLSDGGAFPGLNIGIGIHTGEAMVGNLGGARREYTAIGDVVNVASRVEALNKELGTSILVTEAVQKELGPDAELRIFPSMTIRGRKEPLSLFEVQRIPLTQEYRVPVISDVPVGRVRPAAER